MRKRLTQKQDAFALNIFNGMSQRGAWREAGYSTRYPIAHIDRDASLLANSPKILQRLQELNQRTEDASVASVLERKQVLSSIVRATPRDVLDISQDRKDAQIKPEALESPAVSYIRTEQRMIGVVPIRVTRVGMADKVRAITELNKMENIYSDGALVQNNVNRIVNILVMDQRTKDLIEHAGDRTELLINAGKNDKGIYSNTGSLESGQEKD